MPLQLLVVSKGHPFDRSAFFAMFDADPGVQATWVEQPAARVVLQPENVAAYDAVLFYDMSGISMPGAWPDGAGRPMGAGIDPPDDYLRSIEALLDRGTGIVLLNHALLSWPNWPLWRELSHTSFLLRGGELDGKELPASGFRGGATEPDRNIPVRVVPQDLEHPVLAGLEAGFEIADELYLKTPGFEAQVQPLLRAEFEFSAGEFTASPLASREEQSNWDHPIGSDLVVWANALRGAPIVASDLGDGPSAYENPGFRRLIGNAVRWVASEEARSWAREQVS
jgi:hypothetical protein